MPSTTTTKHTVWEFPQEHLVFGTPNFVPFTDGRGLRLRELVAQSRSLGSSPRPTSFVRWNQIATPTRSNLRLLVASCAALATSPNASSLRFEGSQTWMPRSVVSQFGMVWSCQEGRSSVLELLEKLAESDYLHGLGQLWALLLALGRF